MKPNSPCYKCKDRLVGTDKSCHSDCEKYISYKNTLDEYNNLLKEQKHQEQMFYKKPKLRKG